MKYHLIIIFVILISFSINNFQSYGEEKNILDLESHVEELLNDSKFEESLYYLDKILETDPNNIDALNNKGGVLISIGNYSDAVNNFDLVLTINGNNTTALNNKGIALYHQELYIQSLRSFHKSLLTDPYNQNTIQNTKDVMNDLYWIDETANAYGAVTVRDKNDNIISYSKIDKVNIHPPFGYIFLEDFGDWHEIEIEGEKVKVVTYTKSIPLEFTQYVGRADLHYQLGGFNSKVIELVLNGLIATPEDKISYTVTIIDPTL